MINQLELLWECNFGGARGSGTNDKAGSMQNLLRWTSARTIKETFVTLLITDTHRIISSPKV
jgi:hypothetical protein